MTGPISHDRTFVKLEVNKADLPMSNLIDQTHRMFTRRALTALFVLIVTCSMVGVGLIANESPASAAPSVTILSSSNWTDSLGYVHVVGEVQNAGSGTINSVDLEVNFYDSSNQLLLTRTAYASLDTLNPGEKSPFEVIDNPTGFDHDTVQFINAYTSTNSEYRGLVASVSNTTTDIFGDVTVTGTVTNMATNDAQDPELVASCYDNTGRVVNLGFGFTQKSPLTAGDSDSFSILIGIGAPPCSPTAIATQSSNHLTAPGQSTTTTTPGTTTTVPPATTTTTNPASVTTTTAGPSVSANNSPASVSPTHSATGLGYWMTASDGGVFSFGNAQFFGSTGSLKLNQPIVSMVPTPDRNGYWFVASDGGIFSFGDAQFFGSAGSTKLSQPIVGMASTPDGNGYWLVAKDGGVFAYGDAQYEGSTGGQHLNQPIVGITATPTGNGYWLFASDGGIFAFGDAAFLGSTGGTHLNAPIVGMTSTPSGHGYWFVASDGGIFAYGDATFQGSTGSMKLNQPIAGMASTPGGNGYWLVAKDGGLFSFGDASFFGSMGAQKLNASILGMAVA